MKDNRKFDYFTLQRERDESVTVYGWGTYPRYSVLAGQASKTWLHSCDTEEDARAFIKQGWGKRHAADANWSSRWTEPQVSLMHLSDEGDY